MMNMPDLNINEHIYSFLPLGGRHRGRKVSIENAFLLNCGPPPLIPPPRGGKLDNDEHVLA